VLQLLDVFAALQPYGALVSGTLEFLFGACPDAKTPARFSCFYMEHGHNL